MNLIQRSGIPPLELTGMIILLSGGLQAAIHYNRVMEVAEKKKLINILKNGGKFPNLTSPVGDIFCDLYRIVFDLPNDKFALCADYFFVNR